MYKYTNTKICIAQIYDHSFVTLEHENPLCFINTVAVEGFPWPVEELELLSYQFYKYYNNSQMIPKNNVPNKNE
jgi:hypothetical protein